MISANKVRTQIEKITIGLIEHGMCNQQNFPVMREMGACTEIGYGRNGSLSIALKDVAYKEIYDAYDHEGAFNFKMVDGALVQLLYRYRGDLLDGHRLAFFPSPYLDQFQNSPEIYEQDILFADILDRSIVAFPLRFDFNSDDSIHVDQDHPKSHLTLGEYQHCRIPVACPVTPYWFMDFILRNFYNSSFRNYVAKMPRFEDVFESCISKSERALVHVSAGGLACDG